MEWPPSERMMSSVSPQKRPRFPLWKSMVTSPPAHRPFSSSPAASLAEVLAAFANVIHRAPWPCLCAGLHCQGRGGLRSTGKSWGAGCVQLAGSSYSYNLWKFYTPFSSPDRGSQGGIQFLNNAVNAEFCEPISQAGRPRPFLSF